MKVYRIDTLIVVTLFSILAPMISSTNEVVGNVLSIVDKIAIVILILVSSSIVINRRRLKAPFDLSFYFMVSLISVISSLLFSHNLVGSFYQYFLTFQGFILLLALSQVKLSQVEIYRYIDFILLVGLISSFIGVIEWLYPNLVKEFLHGGIKHEEAVVRGGALSLQSIFGHPGQFSWYMILCLSIVIAKFFIYREKSNLLYAVVFCIMVFLTYRKKSIIAMVIIVTLAVMICNRKGANKVFLVCLVSTMIMFLVFIFEEQMSFLLNQTLTNYNFFSDSYSGPRVALSQVSISIANDFFPFGSGLGTFGSWMSRVNYSPLYHEYGLSSFWGLSPDDSRFATDTYWPMIIAELGYIGTVLILLLTLKLLGRLYFQARRNDGRDYVSLVAFLSLLGVFIESISSPALSRSPQIFIVMIIVAGAISQGDIER
ncbi:oligosaccharide repeat unit polymerase Wzy [Vibrio variabilis]|uniref:Oligosaccharide repeat unit polymerase Wzy n=1 Tax=Vibrio variabilis TaxID=990271 RepID=A0ABQ0J635_9VIBR|nr:oligosaccharide repeat unit polymerase Wzy [Vibrio variabilis]